MSERENAFVGLFAGQSSERVVATLDAVMREIMTNAVIFEPLSGEALQLTANRQLEHVLDETTVRMVVRAQSTTPTFTVTTSTAHGRIMLGFIEVKRVDSGESIDGPADYTTTLPQSLFTVEQCVFEEASGRWLVEITSHGSIATAADLNSPTSALGRLVRFSLVERLARATPAPVSFSSSTSTRRDALLRRLNS